MDSPTEATAEPERVTRVGFFGGLSTFFQGFGFLLRTPRVWPYAAVPTVILVALTVVATWVAFGPLNAWIESIVGAWSRESSWGFVGEALAWIVEWGVTLGGFALLFVLALSLSQPLSGPALEQIVSAQETELGAPDRAPIGVLAEMWCGLRAQLFWWTLTLPLLAILFVVDLVFAPATVVTTPIKICVTSFGLAWSLLDYPLTLRGVRMRDRFAFITRHKREVLGFGAGFAALFVIPCFGVLLLPVGAAAATRLLWSIVRLEPGSLPGLAHGITDAIAGAETQRGGG